MAIKAIFFDLDDTLMDTYGQLVLKAHKEACQAMIEAGLNIALDELYNKRLELIKHYPRQEINELLANHYNHSQEQIIQAGFNSYYNTDVGGIKTFPGVPSLLNTLKNCFELFLVTTGSPRTQKMKVQELQIASFFKDLYYVNMAANESKKEAFEYLFENHDLQPQVVLVVGDRVNNEISIANQLGCSTVWMKHGEFSHIQPESEHEKPDYTIGNINELLEIVQHSKES